MLRPCGLGTENAGGTPLSRPLDSTKFYSPGLSKFMENSPGGISHEAAYRWTRALIKEFVGHWGLMARAWGINSTMGELFALLYITGTDWTAEDLHIGWAFRAVMSV